MFDFFHHFDALFKQLLFNLPFLLKFIAVIWVVYIVNILLKGRLNILGIYPRHPFGLLGVLFAPFLHASWAHLIMNSLMLLILGMMVLLYGKPIFIAVSVLTMLYSGLGIWLLGRKSLHIGASALVMGYFGFLLVEAYYRPNLITIIVAAVCVFFFSGLFVNLFPQDKKTSWEGHVIGFISGIAAVYSYSWFLPYLQHVWPLV